MIAGLTTITAGTALMTALPRMTGTSGYAAALAVITAGYALFQAASTTAAMSGASADRHDGKLHEPFGVSARDNGEASFGAVPGVVTAAFVGIVRRLAISPAKARDAPHQESRPL